MAPNLSWQSGAPIEILGRASPPSRPIWFRHQTPLECTVDGSTLITTSIQLSPPSPSPHELNLDVVRAAVRQLRWDHPAIANEHGWSGPPPAAEHAVFAYEVPGSESDIDVWLSQVVVDSRSRLLDANGDIEKAVDTLMHDLCKAHPLKAPFFLVHYLPAASLAGKHALSFSFNHAVFDAAGSFQIMDLCVSRIADALATGGERSPLPWGEEISRLPPAFVESARIPHTADKIPEDEFMVQRVKDVAQTLSTAHTLPGPRFQPFPSSTGAFMRTASPDVLTTLRTTARQNGATVFSLLMATASLSCIRVRSPVDTANVTLPFLHSPVNGRSLACTDPDDRSQWSVRISMGFNSYATRDLGRFVRSSDDSRQLIEDVWVLAREVRKQTEEQKRHMERMPVWGDDVLAAISEAFSDESIKSSRWSPILSSIGVVDTYLARSHAVATGGELTVSSPLLRPTYPPSFVGCSVALHAFTWGGKLMLTFSFPEGSMGSAEDQAIALKEGRNDDAIGLQFVNEFMYILDVIAQSAQ
ncbi:hypothetical protein DFH07DRAFT_835503 [Mycena maculata]|uniref:Alcohol acetyltransferase n=1 Tax=Mycena maculata TaxID=230809 RepID=A0AAD7IHV1_9AGAR|nr:hypothetical protein DFH07DRAFT_835503 [Mycena maculata]